MPKESTKPPVTDSRMPGFNPEVEQSKAETEAKLNPPEPAQPAAKVDPPKPRDPLEVLRELEAWVRNTHGSHSRFEELMAELWKTLGD